jgi:hypothetical protein
LLVVVDPASEVDGDEVTVVDLGGVAMRSEIAKP